jgi:hypothetical protein
MWMTRTFACSAAISSSRAEVPSVEPSSTRMTSYADAGSDWPSSDATVGSMAGPGLCTGTTTLTLIVIAIEGPAG